MFSRLAAIYLASIVFASPLAASSAATSVSAAPARPLRIVSLIPSLTEDLFAIGAGPNVVAVSQYTDYPAEAAKLPKIASFTSIDAEAIVRLHPDVVVGIPAQRHLVADLVRVGLRVELIDDESYDEIFSSLRRLGTLTGRESEAIRLGATLRARTAELIRSLPKDRPTVFVVLETNPIVTTGNGSYIAHLVALAGGVNAAGDLREAYPRYSGEALVARQPDAIVADRTSGLQNVLSQSPWNALRAVRNGRVSILADADILERPGPRYNDGLAWLIAHLHPGLRGPREIGQSVRMQVTSETFADGGTIPNSAIFNGMGFSGDNESPQLSWSDVPAGTKSFAVVCHDPDAPTSGGFYHWVMFNIPGDAPGLEAGAGTKKIEALLHGEVLGHTDFGLAQYGGPAPPPGPAHHYHFTVYALDDKLPLGGSATGALVEFQAAAHTLAKATITGLFAAPP